MTSVSHGVAYRRPGTVACGWILIAFMQALAVWGAWTVDPPPSPIDALVAGAVIGIGSWVGWLAAVAPALSITESLLVVDQPLGRWEIPWPEFVAVGAGQPLRLRISHGREVRPFAFSGSLIADALGDRSLVRLKDALDTKMLESLGEHGGEVTRRVVLRWRAAVLALTVSIAQFLAASMLR